MIPYNRILRRALALLVFLQLSLLAGAQNKNFFGTWRSESSSVQYEFSKSGSGVTVKAVDKSDGEVLEVSDVKVQGEKDISIHLYTPSTNWNVNCSFHLMSKSKIAEVVSGDGEAEVDYVKVGSKEEKKMSRQ